MNKIVNLENVDVLIDKKIILKNISLNIYDHDFIYFIGKVGSGKSTLLKLLYAEIPLEYGIGEVCSFNLKNIKHKQISQLRKRLGIIFQDFQLLPDRNIYNNLKFVLKATGWKQKEKIDQRITEVLEKVKMEDKKNSMPHQLSGGEQQRIAIARALLNSPEMIIADEPTGNLDPDTSKEILNIFKQIHQNGTAVVIATHDYSLLEQNPAIIYKFENQTINKVETIN